MEIDRERIAGQELEQASDEQLDYLFRLVIGSGKHEEYLKFVDDKLEGTYFEKQGWASMDLVYTQSKMLVRGHKSIPCLSVVLEKYEISEESNEKSFIGRAFNMFDNHEQTLKGGKYIVWVRDQYVKNVNDLESDYSANDNYNEKLTKQAVDDLIEMIEKAQNP